MNYLALGDSISIDDYTGVPGGGAASQFARLIDASNVEDLTYDGCTTEGVINWLPRVANRPGVVTLTIGGNDFLMASFGSVNRSRKEAWEFLVTQPLERITTITDQLRRFDCPVIMNTIYDPTEGDDQISEALGLPPDKRAAFDELNEGLRKIARANDYLLCDLYHLFYGHGIASQDTWVVQQIEPNLKGATAIGNAWYDLYRPYLKSPQGVVQI